MKKHDTPMLDQLEGGPWPSFITGIKRLRDDHPDARINEMSNDLLGQLEHSYETRKGYWKGGTVSVYGYGGIIPRFSEVGDDYPKSREFHTLRVQPPAGNPLHRYFAPVGGQLGEVGLWPGYFPWPDREHHVHRRQHRKHPAFLRRDQRLRLRPEAGPCVRTAHRAWAPRVASNPAVPSTRSIAHWSTASRMRSIAQRCHISSSSRFRAMVHELDRTCRLRRDWYVERRHQGRPGNREVLRGRHGPQVLHR